MDVEPPTPEESLILKKLSSLFSSLPQSFAFRALFPPLSHLISSIRLFTPSFPQLLLAISRVVRAF